MPIYLGTSSIRNRRLPSDAWYLALLAAWVVVLGYSVVVANPLPILIGLAVLIVWRSVLVRRMRRLEREWRRRAEEVAQPRPRFRCM